MRIQIFVALFDLEVFHYFQARSSVLGENVRISLAFLTRVLRPADVDECATGIAVCPRFRKCVNTFGSYICKCHEGFDLQYINGKYQCLGTTGSSFYPTVPECYRNK